MCGFLLSLYLARKRAAKTGVNPDALSDMAIAGLICGIIGARLYYVIIEWGYFSRNLAEIIRIDKGGLVFYGGIIGGALGVMWHIRKNKLPFGPALDVCASVVPLAHAFGRAGCFMNGCCYGRLTDLPWGVTFPRVTDVAGKIIGSDPYLGHLEKHLITPDALRSLPVHPVQLYDAAFNMVIFAYLSWYLSRRPRSGNVVLAYMVTYGVCRSLNEFLRGDVTPHFGTLSLAQYISFTVAGASLAALVWRWTHPLPETAVPQTGDAGAGAASDKENDHSAPAAGANRGPGRRSTKKNRNK